MIISFLGKDIAFNRFLDPKNLGKDTKIINLAKICEKLQKRKNDVVAILADVLDFTIL